MGDACAGDPSEAVLSTSLTKNPDGRGTNGFTGDLTETRTVLEAGARLVEAFSDGPAQLDATGGSGGRPRIRLMQSSVNHDLSGQLAGETNPQLWGQPVGDGTGATDTGCTTTGTSTASTARAASSVATS